MIRLIPIAVVLLMLTAGCAGTTGPSNSTSTTTVTNTTASATTNSSTTNGTTRNETTNATRSAWLAANGAVNVPALVKSNKEQLQSRGFDLTTEFCSTGKYPVHAKRHSRASPNFKRFRSRIIWNNGSKTSDRVWVNETMTQALIQRTTENGTHYRFQTVGPHTRARGMWMSSYYGQNRLSSLLGQATLTVNATRMVNGTRQYTLVGSNISSDVVQNVTLTLTVTQDGAIRRMDESGEFTDGGIFAYHYRARLGVDTVQRPDWVASAPTKANSTAR